MRAVELILTHARIPLRRRVSHALASRSASDNLIVRTRLENGIVGVGEGVPREYVTGETIDAAFELILRSDLAAQIGLVDSFAQAVQMISGLQLRKGQPDPRNMYGNAARCAIELSLLDAFGRHFKEPLSAATRCVDGAQRIRQQAQWVRYSGAITAGADRQEFQAALRTRLYGFRDCKIKVGMPDVDDRNRLAKLRRMLGRQIRIRVDANGAWQPDEVAERIMELAAYDVKAVEQPVAHEQVGTLQAVRGCVPVPIMLDESLCSMEDARRAYEQGLCDMFNIRLSKCGGYVNSVQLAAFAASHGLGYQLGCQVGETGILSAAGRHFASSVAGIIFLEGSYDRYLVEERLTREDLTFGFGGWARALSGPGLGITLDTAALERVTVREERVELVGPRGKN